MGSHKASLMGSNRPHRFVLKISGEAFQGFDKGDAYNPSALRSLADDLQGIHAQGHGIVVMVGGGNIFRGNQAAAELRLNHVSDDIGMLSTVMNALVLKGFLASLGVPSRVLSSIPMPGLCPSYSRESAFAALDDNNIVICAGGMGQPVFTTDTAAVLRGIELSCDMMIKGTKVDGVFSADPFKNPEASFYETLTFKDLLEQDLKVMDAAAVALARDHRLPLIIFKAAHGNTFQKLIEGKLRYTRIFHEMEN